MNAPIAAFLATTCAFSSSLASPAPQLLEVSENQRYLTTEEDRPFFWLGDTAWELFHRLDREEAEYYLTTRAEQGFNLVQAVALAELQGLDTPNPYGHLPLHDQDPARPNEAYFDHVDFIVNKANELGIVVGLLPTWGDKFNRKWGVGPEVFTPANAEAYGRFLGERYRDASVVWLLGGDRAPEEDEDFAIIDAMAKGIRDGDQGRHLITYHPMGRKRSSQYFHDREWLDFNMYQSGHSDEAYPNYKDTLADYQLQPVKPTLDGEPNYEDHPIDWKPDEGWFDEFDSRRAGYWSVLSGALGHTYGNHNVWQMWEPGRDPISSARTPWQEAIHYPGAHQAGYMKAAFESVDWWTLQPAQDKLLDGPEETERHVRVAASPDGALIVAYAPFGSAFVLDLGPSRQRGQATARWFNPRDSAAVPFTPSGREGEVAFDPPADEEPENDWLLILER